MCILTGAHLDALSHRIAGNRTKERYTMTKNPFDFNDVSDIAASNPDLAKRLVAATQEGVDLVLSLFALAATFNVLVLTIAGLQAGAFRQGVALPTEATVRKHLNTAIAQGKIKKINRSSYALAASDVEVEEDAADDAAIDDLA